jgi:hypothetical protein
MLSGNCTGTTSENSVSCTACLPGTYSVGGSSRACTQCPAGFYSTYKSPGCTPCPAGTYAAPGSSFCTSCAKWECAPGEYRSVCTNSEPGTCSPVPLSTQLVVSPVYTIPTPPVDTVNASLKSSNVSSASTATVYVTSADNAFSYAMESSGGIIYTSNDQIPKLSHHTAIATSDGLVFVFGGRLAGNDNTVIQRSNRLYAMHLDYASVPVWWRINGSAVPPARDMHAMAIVGNLLYISGGLGGSSVSGAPLGDVWVCKRLRNANVNDNSPNSDGITFLGNWSLLTSAALPKKMSHHKMVGTPDGKLWIFGGESATEGVLDMFMSLDTNNDTYAWKVHMWSADNVTYRSIGPGKYSNTTSVLMPPPRRDHGMVALGYLVYVSTTHTYIYIYIYIYI